MERRISVKRRKYKQPFSKKFKEYFRNFVAFMFSNVGIILLVISYTVMGAGIFRELEAENFVRHHKSLAANITRIRQVTAKELYNITYHLNPCTEPEYRVAVSRTLKQFQEKLVYAIRRGFESSNETLVSAKWSYPGAFLYSLTVITTIGYGNMCPITPQGKIVTIIYAIVGMPLFLLYLSNIGDVLARSFKWIYANLCLCRWCPGVSKRREERQKRKYGSEESWEKIDAEEVDGGRTSSTSVEIEDTENEESEESYDVQSVTVPVSICLLIMVGYICGGALLFGSIEKWQFLNASYFCFISLSTIGFGDFVPGSEIWNNEHKEGLFEWSFVFCSMYLMLGMALIAMCFNLMQEEVIHKIKTVIRTVKYILRCRR